MLTRSDEEYEKFLQTLPEDEKDEARDILWGMANYTRFHFGDDLQECNARLYGSFWDCPGDNVKIPGGYLNVFNKIKDQISHKISYNKVVDKIDYTNDQIQVRCQDGSLYKADHVVVTIPLGYLKKYHQDLFQPNLPPYKIDSINNMGFGKAGKVFLKFDNPFWAQGEEGLKIAWKKEDIFNPSLPQEWYKSIFGFDEVVNNSNVLVCWIGGQAVEIMESKSESEVIETLHQLLISLTGDESLPKPVEVIKTDWCSQEFTLGSYSFGKMGADIPKDPNNIAEPIKDKSGIPRVLFAGEATHPDMYSTVHGARLTGLREAKRILQLYTL